MQTGLEHVGCRPRRVTPTALISTSRVVFIRQHKSRAQKVVLEHIFGSSVALVWTNSLLVVDPPRPHRIKRRPKAPTATPQLASASAKQGMTVRAPAPLANAPVKTLRLETVVCGRTEVSARFVVAKDIDMVERSRNPGSREWSLRPVIPDTRRKRYGKELRGLSVERLWRCGSRNKLAVPVR